MKAIRVREFGMPEVMKLEEVPDLLPGAGQVVVRVRAAGVNPLDTLLRLGIPIGEYEIKLPYTPGYEIAGDVIAIGENVKRIQVGDRVYAEAQSGAYAEQALCEEYQVYPLPENLSYTQGSAIYIAYKTAYFSLFDLGQAQLGDTVLIHGASGTVGTAAVQLARSAASAQGVQAVQEQGVQFALNHREDGYLQKIHELTANRGVDVILKWLLTAICTKI